MESGASVKSKKETEFDFERLDVYQRALNFIEKIFLILEKLPNKAQGSLGDQLRRAAVSIANNIAEGSNKNSWKGKTQFYGYALNSARECAPMLTICYRLKYFDLELFSESREEILIISKMLRRLIEATKE
ncbi:MAG: four helix bundle protein [Candidatus Subteraquimicrobiales bacterium]|nr:four helix bundle protein [Candidatus Subteraquimicrobiales bacterium]